MIVWICGLSGSGKTTIATEMRRVQIKRGRNPILIDGDAIRSVFGECQTSDSYSLAGRKRNAELIAKLVSWLDGQSIDVIVAVQSIFPEMLANNRTLFRGYFEIHLDATLNLLQTRDPKGLHENALSSGGREVVGYGIPYTRPTTSDMFINMDEDTRSPREMAESLSDFLEDHWNENQSGL